MNLPAEGETMTPEEFEMRRRKTIELLHPAEVAYLKECAGMVDMSYEDLLEAAKERLESGDYVSMGSNTSYQDIDWDRFWKAYFFVTNTLPDKNHDGWGFFSCSC